MNPINSTEQKLSDPFAQLFTDWAEADWAFDLLRETVRGLRVDNPYDARVAVTLSERSGKLFLRLNFGNWLVLGFRGPGREESAQIDMVLLANYVAWDERFTAFTSDRKEGEPEVRSYELPLEAVQQMSAELQTAYEATVEFIAAKFQSWKKATHWKQHNPELIEAMFNPDRRTQLFSNGLGAFDLRYERHFTAFSRELAEEIEGYEAEAKIEEIGDKEVNDDEITEDIQSPNPSISPSSNPPISPSPNPLVPLPKLAEETGFEQTLLTRWVNAIERKGQAIVYGPPGTGKTYIAEKLATHLVGGGDGFVELVQFHPAYAYEDFIQGIRPQSEGDHLQYPLVSGRFLTFCQQASQCTGRCVLIIDEINRANLARVFGELMYLLEYRDRTIPLASGGPPFRIPPNIRIIGTMNTADRSIALVDHALRRRFAFLALYPNFALLQQYHQKYQTGYPIEPLIKVLTQLNRQIDDPHYELGITYFLHKDLAKHIADIWQMEIEPYLEEFFFDRPDQVEAFRWDNVKTELTNDEGR